MASEFKIGRLRFNWDGTWVAGTFYNRDAIVNYQGKTYVCIVPNTASADFYSDLYFITPSGASTPYWSLIVDGKTWVGNWITSTLYSLGNIVIFGGTAYYCSTAHASTAFAADSASWTEYTQFSNWHITWTANTAYGLNDVVRYGGIVYRCVANHTSAASTSLGLEADQASWLILNSGIQYKGSWTSGVRYKTNDLVKNGPDLWKASAGHTSTSLFDPLSWTLWLPGLEFANVWTSTSVYQPGDTVNYGGYTYVGITINNTGNTPSLDAIDWTLLVTGYDLKGDWSTMSSYKIGDVVSLDGRLYEAVADSTAQNPAAFSKSTTYTSAGSSGTVLVVASGTGIAAGALIIGAGFTQGQRVISVSTNTVILSNAPDGTLVNGQALAFVGVNYLYWAILVPGVYWTNLWIETTFYNVGDIAVWQNTTYMCLQSHTAVLGLVPNRPDTDTNNQYWTIYIAHSRKNALNTSGDIESYNAGQYAAVPIGSTSLVLRNSSNLPAWAKINVVPGVYYVAANGTDRSDYGVTWDQPWRTIAYAAARVGNGSQYQNAAHLISVNKTWLTTEMYQWMLYQMSISVAPFSPSSTFDQFKTIRDAGYVIDSLIYDMTRGANSQIVATTIAYFAIGSTSTFVNTTVAAEMPYIIAALTQLNVLITNVINNVAPVQSFQTLNGISDSSYISQVIDTNYILESGAQQVVTTLYAILSTALSSASTMLIPAANSGETATVFIKTGTYSEILPIVIPGNIAFVGDELRGVVVQPAVSITTTCNASTAGTNVFTVVSTTGMADQMPVQFVAPSIASTVTYTTFGGVTAGQTYYIIGSSITAKQFSITTTASGTITGITTADSTLITNITNITNLVPGLIIAGDGIPPDTTIISVAASSIVVSAKSTITASNVTIAYLGTPLELSSSIGGTMTVYAGDCLKDMFRMRNGSGLRNMSLAGLLGTLGAPDSNQIQRPTGGSYASLDPGTGPNDTSVWITRRSPYVQNVSTFGNGCAGMKIDGALHNGGNKSMVSNDFTQIISDGIGVWCTGPGSLTEAVSVFSYYGYAGYFAEAGGRIRATNGNSSYGQYGVIAAGYDITEPPATGTVFNQSTQIQAVVQSAFGTIDQLLGINFSNAGSAYNSSTTNLIKYSNNFQGANWASDSNVTFSKNTIAPTGISEAWTFTGNTAGPDGSYIYQDIAINPAGAAYTALGAVNISGSGVGATFNVTVTSTGYVVTVSNGGGSGYVTGNQLFISGGQLGGINSVNDCIITVSSLSGSAILTVSVSGTVPAGSNQNYTLSAYVKQGSAATVDLYGIFSGSTTVTSAISYNFATGAVTALNANGGYLPVQYGAISTLSTGWVRIWFALNDTSGLNNNLRFKIYPRGYTGLTNQSTYFYGTQAELSSATYTPSFYLEVAGASRYTAFANYNITGAGTGVIAIGNEIRSKSVFQTRITDPGSGAGGAGYLTASNSAQAGTDTYIQISQSDNNTSGNYTGMRIFINSGTGAGQYGYISYFNASTKVAYVLKESFTSLPTTITAATGGILTLGGSGTTTTLYQNQPVQFIPTYYTTAVTSTSLAQIQVTEAIGGTTNTFTVASTAGLSVNMAVTFTGTTFSTVVPGYTYYIYSVLDGNTIQIASQLFGNIWPLTAGTGGMIMDFTANTSYLTCTATSNMIVNYPIQFTGSSFGGLTVGTVYYVNDVIDVNNFTIAGALVTISVTATNSSNNGLSVVSTSTISPLNTIIFSAPTFGNIVDGTKYYISKIIDSGTFTVSSSLLTVAATATEITTNLITVTSTTGFIPNNPINFVGTTFGGIVSETVYYILAINDAFTFTISQTPGGGALSLSTATGSATARTAPTSVTLASASGTMPGTSTSRKATLSYGSGIMNATFSTQLFGGVVIGTTYYINSILSTTTYTVSSVSGSGTPITLTDKTGSMNLAAVGWEHINSGTPIVSNLDSSSAYYIEPRTSYSAPAFSQSVATAPVTLAGGTTWVSIAYGNGVYMALPSGNSTAAISVDGSTWTSMALPTTASWSNLAYGNGYWVAIGSGGLTASPAIYSNSNGAGWRTASLPSSTTWSSLVYGNGIFVAIATGTNSAAYSNNSGATWTASTLPSPAVWSSLAYGASKFVAIASSGTSAAYSTNGSAWTAVTLPSSTAWSSIAYGAGQFIAVSSTSKKSAYSFDGITWYSSNQAIVATQITYGQGVFVAVSASSTTAYTSEGGASWTIRTVTNDGYTAIAFGFDTQFNGKFVTLAGVGTGSIISAGCTTKGRAIITSGIITSVSEWEPGSGYVSVPSVTFTDPNVTSLASVTPRISNGVLSSPTFVNRGSGYTTNSTVVLVTGNGYADTYQTGLTITLNALTRLPSPGDNLTIAGVTQVYKVTSAVAVYGTVAPTLQANVSLSPSVSIAASPANGTVVSIRSKYSQARLSNHDFLNIGYGDFEASNYPGFPDAGYVATAQNQTIEVDYGRVFVTSTDQDGNFKVGNLFGVQQATGIVTLSASQFGLTGLSTLSLGGISVGGSSVVVSQFGTDSTFTANSDSIIPTQRAIKAYLASRLSQGGANTFTGQLIAGTVLIGGANKIASTLPNGVTGSVVKMVSKINITGANAGVDGNMAALEFFSRSWSRKT